MSGYNNIAVGGGYCNEYLPMDYGEQNEKNKRCQAILKKITNMLQ